MWAFISTISLSLEATINKKLVKKNNVFYYLANKFWVGLIPIILIYLFSNHYITSKGIVWLGIICIMFALQQFIAFSGLARISASTNIVIKQMRLFFLLIISFAIGDAINLFDYLGVALCFIGGILITFSETKESSNKKDSIFGIVIALTNALVAILISFLIGKGLGQAMFSSYDYSLFTIIAVIVVFNILHAFKKNKDAQIFSKNQMTWLQISGVLSVAVNLTRALAIETIGVFYSEIIMSLAPIFIYVIALIYGSENLTLRRSLGVIVTVGGVLLTFIPMS